MSVADERRPQFAVVVFRARDFEIEHADSVARLPLVNTAVARTDHDTVARFLFASEINHGVRNRRVALDRISAGPEEQVARLKVFQLERVVLATEHRLEFSGAPEPNVLLA